MENSKQHIVIDCSRRDMTHELDAKNAAGYDCISCTISKPPREVMGKYGTETLDQEYLMIFKKRAMDPFIEDMMEEMMDEKDIK